MGRAEHSAALLANAAHFASDFIGSLAVLVGLILVAFGVQGGDSVAAMFVSVIVLVGAARLAWINVDMLMDRAPTGTAGRVERAALAGARGDRGAVGAGARGRRRELRRGGDRRVAGSRDSSARTRRWIRSSRR